VRPGTARLAVFMSRPAGKRMLAVSKAEQQSSDGPNDPPLLRYTSHQPSLHLTDLHDMPQLFQERTVRSITAAALAAFVAHVLTLMIPPSMHTFNLMQSSVAMLALASLSLLVVMHHRRSGQFLTQMQEEMILIAAFGLFWFAVLVAYRAFNQRTADPRSIGEVSLASATQTGRGSSERVPPGFTAGRRTYPCSSDAVYCVVEEWTWL